MTAADFPPGTVIVDIIEEIAEHEGWSNGAPIILYGDFNRRIDPKDPTGGHQLEEALG